MATNATATPAPSQSESAKSIAISNKAKTYAAQVTGNVGLTTTLKEWANTAEFRKIGPLVFLGQLTELFGSETLAEWPDVGSENTDKTPTNNPDITRRNAKNSKGKPTTIRASFYDDLADDTGPGREASDMLAVIGKRASNKETPDHLAEADGNLWTARRNAFRNLFKTTMRLQQMLWNMSEFPKVEVHILTDDKLDDKGQKILVDGKPVQELRRTTTPIFVVDVSNLPTSYANYRTLSIGQFLTWNPDRAGPLGGTLEAFIETAGREPETAEQEGITTLEDFESYANDIASFLLDKDKFARAQVIMNKKEKDGRTPTQDAKDMIEALGDIYHAVDGVFARFSNMYEAIKDARNAADAKFAEAEKKDAADTKEPVAA